MWAVVLTVLAAYAVWVYSRMQVLKAAIKGSYLVGPSWLRHGFLWVAKFLSLLESELHHLVVKAWRQTNRDATCMHGIRMVLFRMCRLI